MQERSETTRRRLLQAAQQLFAQQGYETTSVQQICQAAGVSKGAFYHHFPSKHALFLHLLQRWLAGIQDQLQQAAARMDDVPAGLRAMASGTQGVFQSADGRLAMFLEFLSQARLDPQVWQATLQPYQQYRDFFAQIVRRGVAEGSLRPVDPQVAARAVVALAVGLLLQSVLEPSAEDWPQVAQQSVALLLQGLERREP